MIGSQPSSTFLGIEALSLNFSSLTCMRAFVIYCVKATFIALALGLLARFCKNLMTSEILQLSKSKSLLSKVKGDFPILWKNSAHLSETGLMVLDFFVVEVGFPSSTTYH